MSIGPRSSVVTASGGTWTHRFTAVDLDAVPDGDPFAGMDGAGFTIHKDTVAPGPPTAAFTASRLGPPLTYAFHDASHPGIGGAAVVAWLWSFGDAASPANLSGLQNPQHAFSSPGTYQVCLIVTDANRRHSSDCAPVVVSASGAAGAAATPYASKRTVASTALSSPIS